MTDTIAAIATGQSVSAIGIVRISGPRAVDAARAMFSPFPETDRKLVYGNLRTSAEKELLDACMCTVSHAPDSYTGEDTVEFQCHGSPVLLSAVLDELFKHGVRQALPGEFTKRAFLNGKLQLADAEAVADIIDAETVEGVKNAADQLTGAVSKKMNGVYSQMLDICAHFHAVLDYPDEDIEDFQIAAYAQTLLEIRGSLQSMLSTYDRGRFLNTGIPAAIAGKPNAGKSSLLNALLGFERAIVTAVPGTTRDTIEEKIRIGKLTLRLIDTAGMHEAGDEIERLGIERTKNALDSAELVIRVIDGAAEETGGGFDFDFGGKKMITVINKSDLPGFNPLLLEKYSPAVAVSAKTGEGLNELMKAIEKLFEDGKTAGGNLISNARHAEALKTAVTYLDASLDALENGETPDIVLTELEGAINAIGLLTGASITADVTNRIFSRFCVGK